ncbi:helix-turn-helix domain-containing protein [Gordonia sp. DT218]|uniref:helix-turn-helix domain-containing protein n=1 Tax=Gordonia sp. DT218 TaxID=3416659 RepID=UPI003CEBD06F
MHEVAPDVGDQSEDASALAVTLGAAIRSARKNAGLTLQALAQRTGLSQSFLSQAENGHTVPSILNLHTIARSLGTTAHELLSPSDDEVSLVRASDGPLLEASPGATMRRCARRSAAMAANEITAGPGTSASSATEHAGEEFVYVIAGALEMEVGATTYRLAPGDVLYYAATVRHRWHNRADRPARFLITSSPPF